MNKYTLEKLRSKRETLAYMICECSYNDDEHLLCLARQIDAVTSSIQLILLEEQCALNNAL